VPEDCRAVSEVIARVGDKWTVLVVTLLGDGSKRFNELRRGLGSISQRMLTLTLRGLERDKLVTRTVFPTIPPRVDYELTKLGHSLLEPVSRLGLWARQNRAAIQAKFNGAILPLRGGGQQHELRQKPKREYAWRAG
jgi:DNA-binding HxlR family transcriptional regulator